MADLILFRIQNHRVAVKQSDILLILNKCEKFSNNQSKIKIFNRIRDIRPINSEYLKATQFIYFDGQQQLECIGVSDIKYIEDFDEDNIICFTENRNNYGIIGFINQDEDQIPIINILKWLKNSEMNSCYWVDSKM